MNDTHPAELVDLQEDVAEMFYFVKRQGQLAGGNLDRTEPLGDTDATERQLHERLFAMGRKLMGEYFVEVGGVDLGPRLDVDDQGYIRKHKQRAGSILTVFGNVAYKRDTYYSGDGDSLRPFEAMANLPARKSTYFAQDLMARLGIEDTYSDSQEFYADFFGHSLSPRTIEEVIGEMSQSFSEYMKDKPVPADEDERPTGVVSFDGKGITVVPAERTTGKTREALVGCVYTTDMHERDPEKLARSLIFPTLLSAEEKDALRAPVRPQNTEYFGSIQKAKDAVFEDVKKAAEVRFAPLSIGTVICLMDGALGLWNLAKKHFPDAVYILDVMHVLKYLWDAAKALKGDQNEARELVYYYLTMILQGQVDGVIRGLRIRLGKNRLLGKKREAVKAAITYFENHRDYMRYDEYLAQGYPVASGVIESACRHIIQDRMERAGTQWSMAGAESVLNMRCVKANRDWRYFQQIRKQKECESLYSATIEKTA